MSTKPIKVTQMPYWTRPHTTPRRRTVAEKRGDVELASVMRKLLLMPGPAGYASIDVMNGAFEIDCSGLTLTEDEQQAIEEVWDQ